MRSVTLLVGACSLWLAGCSPDGTSDGGASVPGDSSETTPYAEIAEDEVLHFTGTEPFWGGEVSGTTLVYSTPENQDGAEIEVERFAGRGGIAFSGLLDGAAFEMMVITLFCFPDLPALLNFTSISPLLFGAIGSFGHEVAVQPHVVSTLEMTSGSFPVFLNVNVWETFSPWVISPNLCAALLKVIFGPSGFSSWA